MKFRTKLLILSCITLLTLFLLIPFSAHSKLQIACCYTQCPVTGDCCSGDAFQTVGYCHFKCYTRFGNDLIETADIDCN